MNSRLHTLSLRLLPALALLLTAAACEFRPLEDPNNVTYLRVYIDEQITNLNTDIYNPDFERPEYQRPEILRAALFDPDTGELLAERYLRNQGDDERGHYFDGQMIINPGTYDLVVYNFGTESTIIGSEYNVFAMNAFTNEIAPALKSKFKSRSKTDFDEETIRYDADPLFVVNAKGVEVPKHAGIDTLRNASGEPWFTSKSVVDTYFLQIGVINAQYIASSACLLSGMASYTHLLDPDYEASPETTLYFEMLPGSYPDGYKPGVKDYRCIYTTFGTFGRLPESVNNLSASFEFVTTYGKQVDTTFNIALEFLKEDAIERNWLLLDCEINIPPPGPDDPGGEGTGGLAPSVDDWDEENSEIDI